jgi:ATP-binding protein involved in chromosome partitioning
MSYFIAPDTGKRYEIFGHGGARAAAEELGLEFLGEVPLDQQTREGADTGAPISHSAPDSPQAAAFMQIAEKLAARCSVQAFMEEVA